MRTFENIEAFYAERGGARSGEMDQGAWWRDARPRSFWRLSVVHSTGDVYAEAHHDRTIMLLGTLNSHGRGDRHDPLAACGDDCAYAECERALAGYTEYMSDLNSLVRAISQIRNARPWTDSALGIPRQTRDDRFFCPLQPCLPRPLDTGAVNDEIVRASMSFETMAGYLHHIERAHFIAKSNAPMPYEMTRR